MATAHSPPNVRLPPAHPAVDLTTSAHASLIQSFVIHHPDGLILVDTGCGDDNEVFTPDVNPVVEALNSANVDERDIVAIINTHLHFDHCGQNRSFPGVAF